VLTPAVEPRPPHNLTSLGTSLAIGGSVVGFVSGFLPTPALHGWMALGGFGVSALAVLTGLMPYGPRRQSLAFGTFMLVFAVSHSLGDLWAARPSWLEWTLTQVLMLAAFWFAYEVYRAKRIARPVIRL
jgi:hypothetical protein